MRAFYMFWLGLFAATGVSVPQSVWTYPDYVTNPPAAVESVKRPRNVETMANRKNERQP